MKPFKKPKGRLYEKKFFRYTRLQGELGYRGNENFTQSKLLYSVLGIRYRLLKGVQLGFDYRYNMRGAEGINSSRIDGQVNLSHDVDRYSFSYRFNAQHEFEAPTEFRSFLRNRIGAGYNIRKCPVDPVASAEFFTLLHYTGNRLLGIRYELGANWKISKRQELEAAMRYDREMNIAEPRYRMILALSYTHDLR
ncbi:MAG: DUF2490 domain-containing protein [Flavobacteriales bacterium]|nr:DUF2490 domain-containing protein [Flavobacteriales bacterium]